HTASLCPSKEPAAPEPSPGDVDLERSRVVSVLRLHVACLGLLAFAASGRERGTSPAART
ncbi:MAG: hypothetical protein ACRD1T_11210, partial [Acidimicrobiia bacterium]